MCKMTCFCNATIYKLEAQIWKICVAYVSLLVAAHLKSCVEAKGEPAPPWINVGKTEKGTFIFYLERRGFRF